MLPPHCMAVIAQLWAVDLENMVEPVPLSHLKLPKDSELVAHLVVLHMKLSVAAHLTQGKANSTTMLTRAANKVLATI